MTNHQAREDESMFYALVQKSLLKDSNQPINIRAISWLYGFFSNYGQSFLRAFVRGLIPTFFIVVIVYAFLASPFFSLKSNLDWGIIGNSIDCAFQQIVKPFSFYSANKSTFVYQLMYSHPVAFRITAILQTFLIAVFITLIFLAMRWRFKRD